MAIEGEEESGSNNYFCWGQCFGPLDDTSLISKQILSNDTSYEFQGEYEPRMNAGTSVVRYVFYNINNTTDTVSATVNYIAEPLGIDNNRNDNNEISNAYPNPANDITTVKYILPKNDINLHNHYWQIHKEDQDKVNPPQSL